MLIGISLVVQWLRLCTSTAGAVGSIPGQGTKIPHATKKIIRCSQKKKSNNNAYHFRVSVAQEFRHGQGGSLNRLCSRCHLGMQVSQSTSWGTFRVGGPFSKFTDIVVGRIHFITGYGPEAHSQFLAT